MAQDASKLASQDVEAAKRRSRLMRRFLVPSIIGILLFMLPFPLQGTWTIMVKVIADLIGSALGGTLVWLCVAVLTVS